MKYLLILLIFIVFFYVLWRHTLKILLRFIRPLQGTTQRTSEPQTMVRCHYCDIHIPEHDAVYRAGLAYCSPEHVAMAGSRSR